MENKLEEKSLEQIIRELNTMREIAIYRHKETLRELDNAVINLKKVIDDK